LTASAKKIKPRRPIPLGLKRVRKAIPPPGKIFKRKNKNSRERAKVELGRELKESFSRNSS
jgi:hypothetical protein